MEIQLDKTHKIVSDDNQYILKRLYLVKGKPVWKNFSYFVSINNLFKSIPEQLLRESNAMGWTECKAVLESTRISIQQALEQEEGRPIHKSDAKFIKVGKYEDSSS